MLHHLITIMFYAGQFLHFLLKADAVSKSAKNKAVNTVWGYFVHYRIILLARLFASTCFYMIWLALGPKFGLVPNLDTANFPPSAVAGVSGLIGLAIDSVLDKLVDKWDWLRGQIPAEPAGEPEPVICPQCHTSFTP